MATETGGVVWVGTPSIKGSSEFSRMALLTFSLIGLQFTWGLEMTYCTPYLLDLGLTKSKTSLVWIAGPLSGMIMAPAVGAIADRSKSRFGRRRPFMVGGAVLVILCLFVLGWAREIVQFWRGGPDQSSTIVLAVFAIYALDFSINAVQWACRGLIVDTLPVAKQQLGSAWAARMVAIGHLIGYAAGAVDLGGIFGDWIGDTQFKRVTVIAALAMLIATAVTSWAVTERVLVSEGSRGTTNNGPIAIFSRIFRTALHMPVRIRAICWCQFWQWVAWFPFLFYSSTWVGEVYMRYDAPIQPKRDMLGEMGRIGSTALIVFSAVSFLSSCAIPWMIKFPDEDSPGFRPRPPRFLARLFEKLQRRKPSLLTGWFASQFIFALAMACAPLVRSLSFASLLVALSGIPWAFTSWAPFSFMGVEINRLGRSSRGSSAFKVQDPEKPSRAANGYAKHVDGEADEGLSGIYLGILNLFTTSAQMVGTFISTIVFHLLEPGKSAEFGGVSPVRSSTRGVNAISICLFIGACAAIGAAYAIRRLSLII